MGDVKSTRRGRPLTDPVDRFRSKLWYQAIRFVGNDRWNDYRLDIEFLRDVGEERPDGAGRTRGFGRIKKGQVPSSGKHPRRPYDLVARVDAHPDFSGTATYFRSAFWELLRANTMGLAEAHAFVSRCMAASQVHRPSGKLEMAMRMWDAGIPTGIHSMSGDQYYQAALMRIVTSRPNDLELLALVGGLFREAYLACALDIAVVLKSVFLDLLSEYCQQEWLGELGDQLSVFAENRLLYWRLDSSSWHEDLYDCEPVLAIRRPLLPVDENTSDVIHNQNGLYDALMQEFIEAVWAK